LASACDTGASGVSRTRTAYGPQAIGAALWNAWAAKPSKRRSTEAFSRLSSPNILPRP
jgi:hypothetical protein